MARSVNKVILVGNVGQDPEMRHLASGKKVVKFSLATSKQWTDHSGQRQEKTEWHRLQAWERLAEIITEYVKKGDRLYVEGELQYGSYEKDGVTVYTTDITVREMVMLGSSGAPSDQAAARNQPAPSRGRAPITEPEDDLPF